MKKIIVSIGIAIISTLMTFAQPDINQMERDLADLSKVQPGLTEKVQLSVTGISLSDFIAAIAYEHNLNVSVEEGLKNPVINNFYDATVKDVFIFLIKKHNLIIDISGSIIYFKNRPEEKVIAAPYTPKPIDVSYRAENKFLSINLKKDSLYRVAEAITRASNNNVVLSPAIKDRTVSVYIENRPFEQVLEMLAKSNGLKMTVDGNGFYYLDVDTPEPTSPTRNGSRNTRQGQTNQNNGSEISLVPNPSNPSHLDVTATNAPISALIDLASNQLGENYFMYDEPDGMKTLKVENVSFVELLSHILNGTDYTFKKTDQYYLIGNRNTEGLRATDLIRLQNRTVETVIDLIPAELINDIEIKEFVELNGMVVSGSYLKIEELKSFVRAVDQVVPMVQIDVLIVYSGKSATIKTGMKAKLGDPPTTTVNGEVFPGLDVTMGSQTINGLIQAFNGFGLINLGFVTPEFYLSLSALETNGVIETQSTPKISTLNGHEATMAIGETDYYQEVQTTFTNTINGGNLGSNKIYRETQADLSITVKPFVSADEHVTLEITVEQTDFKDRTDPNAPPGKTTQTFQSLVRVKNGEMILMGGLEKDKKSNSGEGTPFLSRVPVLKWFFSSRSKEKEKSKLHVFIKPTVTY